MASVLTSVLFLTYIFFASDNISDRDEGVGKIKKMTRYF